MHLFVGLRTKNCEIIKKVKCTGLAIGMLDVNRIVIEGLRDDELEIESFARADGFTDYNQLRQFFTGQGRKFPFCGYLHRWS